MSARSQAPGKKGKGSRVGYLLIALFWILIILLSLLWQIKAHMIETPLTPGCKTWNSIGAVLALAPITNAVYAGGNKGLFLVSTSGLINRVMIPGAPKNITIFALKIDSDGTLFVGHDHGLSIYNNNKRWITIRCRDGLPDNCVKAIEISRSGLIWVGTRAGAVSLKKAGANNWAVTKKFAKENKLLLADSVSVIYEDSEGGIWFANYGDPEGGLNYLKNNKWVYWTKTTGLPHPYVTSIIQDHKGRILAGSGFMDKGGLVILEQFKGHWIVTKCLSKGELAGNKVRSLFVDSKNRLWIGSECDGVAIRYHGRTIRILTVKDGLPAQEVISITETQNGSIWLGTINGLSVISASTLKSLLRLPSELSSN